MNGILEALEAKGVLSDRAAAESFWLELAAGICAKAKKYQKRKVKSERTGK